MKIAIIEDDRSLRDSLGELFSGEGYETAAAAGLREARALEEADLWLVDVMLPDGSGIDFVREKRKTSTMPILILTALDGEDSIIAGLKAGADDYIVKPFRAGELLARVDANLRRVLPGRYEIVSGLPEAEIARFRRRRIGFVHQDYNLFPEYTAWENVILPIRLDGAAEDRKKTARLFEALGIDHCRDRFPHELSGGEQQRVSLARALITEPAVVLADEPTGNLDAENSGRVAELLRFACDEYRQSIIMVTHDAAMADYADRILRIRDGVVSE